MTTPEPVTPSKSKSIWATVISLLGAAVPIIAQVAGWLPEPYGAVLSGILVVISALTGGATYAAPYKPPGTVLVPTPVANPDGTITNPWK